MLYFGEGAPKNPYAAHQWFHRAAKQGHVGAQINLAVMHYLGNGGAKDLAEARHFFRLAKKNGIMSQNESVKLGLSHKLADLAARAGMRPRNTESQGEATYATFCAGCHGLNGIAAYVQAPSFALGERMDKTDEKLFHTITHGHGVMPAWRDKLTEQSLLEALQFVRTLPQQYQNGIAQVLRTPPSVYFLFGPMSTDPIGIYQDYGY